MSALWWASRGEVAGWLLELAAWVAGARFYIRGFHGIGEVGRIGVLDSSKATILYNVKLTGRAQSAKVEVTDLTGRPSTWPPIKFWDYDAFGPMQPGYFKPYHPEPDGQPGPLNFRAVSRPNPCDAPPPGLEARLEERT